MIAHLSKSETMFVKFNLKMGLLTKCRMLAMRQYSAATGNHVLNDGHLREKMSLSTSIVIHNILRFIFASNSLFLFIIIFSSFMSFMR